MTVLALTASPPPPHLLLSNPTTTPTTTAATRLNHHSNLLNHLQECTTMPQLKQIHARTIHTTLPGDPNTLFVYSTILHFCLFNDVVYARKLFDQIHAPNSFMWNALIRAHASSQDRKFEAILLYERMVREGNVLADKHTYTFVLKACAYLFALCEGRQVHCQLVKLGFASDVYVNNSLIHFYGSCGCLDLLMRVFDKMPQRSLVSWNSMIDGLVRLGDFETALKRFVQLQGLFDPDGYTIQSVLNACGGLCALSLGMWIHAYILKNCDVNVSRDVLVNNFLIDMYCKCGSLDLAIQVFDRMGRHDLTSWNSIILGLAMHGKGELALQHFDRMVTVSGIAPNSITFVGVLSACNHRHMVKEGRKYFDMMINEYKISPQLEHYGCLVDTLARSGLIYEALDLVSSMPLKPDAVIWRSLLDSCCKKNGSVELSEEMARQILESDGGDSSGVYVLLSRVYASARLWNDVGLVRKLMTDHGVTKEPGCSLIEIDGIMHEIFAGDTSHPQTKEIYHILDVIDERLRQVGYTPDYSAAPLVDELDDGKQQSLRLHSERLAIALGLLNSKQGVPIRVFKNLRVCSDCHEVSKLISNIFEVEIIMRDRNRFHHFKEGSCSCQGHW